MTARPTAPEPIGRDRPEADPWNILRAAGWDTRLELGPEDVERMEGSSRVLDEKLARGEAVYGVTRGFGPLVDYGASDSLLEQGAGLIAHLGSGQGRPLPPEVSRLVVSLRLSSMRRGHSSVSPGFWRTLADLWNRGFTPCVPRDGSVSASGDLQPLAHAALAFAGRGEAWVREDAGWRIRPAEKVLADLGAAPVQWRAREALAFVNGTSVGLAQSVHNHTEVMRLARATAMLTGRNAFLLGANPEAFHEGIGLARGQVGQLTAARWIREELPREFDRSPSRPLQEPYSIRCAPQVIGAVLDQVEASGAVLAREASGCTDNPVCVDGEILHGGNFHAMPVALASDQIGLCLQQIAYLAERQLALFCSPTTNGRVNPMLTPDPGGSSGLAGVQISATSFVSRIRQLVYPASLTALPTNNGNQDHVPMALNGANAVAEAVEMGWLVIASLAVGTAQYAALLGHPVPEDGVWRRLADACPPLAQDRPLAAEVRAARTVISESTPPTSEAPAA
ncbi:aromatic amino acid ammonia-lyase [Nocardiopsis quinghaiensis]|uniref:aromatic amino acid ammonia-lyase n=1 Tax=Nocardiopsis quinghaiensis TaxID=464995 RepID=UPI001CC231AB|nr:aromatic amino acid ammonia-lyase [Nocardiopsis quinghaiensis]